MLAQNLKRNGGLGGERLEGNRWLLIFCVHENMSAISSFFVSNSIPEILLVCLLPATR